METITVISSGQYSDYRVLGAVSSKEAADKIVERANSHSVDRDGYPTEWRVETIKLIPDDVEPVSILRMWVDIQDDGTTKDLPVQQDDVWEFDHYEDLHRVVWQWHRFPRTHEHKGGRLSVYGTEHERVRRVFSDRRAQLLAEDAFRMKPRDGGFVA